MLYGSLAVGILVVMFGTFEPVEEIKDRLSSNWFAVGIKYDASKIPDNAIVVSIP